MVVLYNKAILTKIVTVLKFAVAVGFLLFLMLWCSGRDERNRLQYNQTVLLDSITVYRVRDSLTAISIGVLTLERDDLKRYRAQDAELIKDLNLRLRRVMSVGKVFSASKYEIRSIEPIGDRVWRYKTPYIDFKASLESDLSKSNSELLSADVVIYDTIVQVLHRVPKFKFLGIWFGTRGVRQEIVSKNPHTVIVAAEYIDIKR